MKSEIFVQYANENNAEAVLSYLQGLIEEKPPFLPLQDTLPTVEEEKKWMRQYIEPENSTLLLAFSEEQVIGVLEFNGQKLGMSVDKNFRNRGVGRQLLGKLFAWARSTGTIKQIKLEVYENNHAAVALYKKMGFLELGRKENDKCINGDTPDIICMSLKINNHTPQIQEGK